jgi:hypothetical protein
MPGGRVHTLCPVHVHLHGSTVVGYRLCVLQHRMRCEDSESLGQSAMQRRLVGWND